MSKPGLRQEETNLSEEQIDQIVVGQANDASAWDEPVRVKRTTAMTEKDENVMRSEYDFRAGVRGKHYRAMQKGYTVTIHQTDGSTLVEEVMPSEGVVVLEPDVQEYFPDSVNDALPAMPGPSGEEA